MKRLDLTSLDHEAEAAWRGVLDLTEVCPAGWSLAGGQAVYVQSVLRGSQPPRPSSDADVVVDLRADPGAARTVVDSLRVIGFEPTRRDFRGRMHRWARGDAQIDVLQPRFLGERLTTALSKAGIETIGAPGAQHLLNRSEQVEVSLGDRVAEVRSPTILGAIVAKAAAYQEIFSDPDRVRHLADALTLAPLVTGRDLRIEAPWNHLERRRLGSAAGRARSERARAQLLPWFPDDLDFRIERLARLHKR